MRRRRGALLASTVVTAVVTLTAMSGCTSASTSSSSTGAAGSGSKDTLTLGMTADITTNYLETPPYQGWAGDALYDTLIQTDALGKPQPRAAEKWEFNAGNTGATVHLRSGMKFSDGTAVDSAAVKASYEYAAKKNARFAGVKIATPDPQTAVITFPKPQPLLAIKLGEVRITTPKAIASGNLNDTPVGSGPYTLDAGATTRGSVYTFTKSESYWDTKTYPYKKLVMKVITSNTAAVNALKTGQIDGSLIESTTYNEATGSGLKIQALKGRTTRLLVTDHLGKKIPALGNADVRRAMNMVFDKDTMAKNLYQGHAEPAAQIFRPGSTAYIDGMQDPYPYNVDAAKALMAKAGYANGFTLEIPFMQGQGLEPLIPVVTQQLGLLNIKVKQVTLSGPNAIADLLSGKFPVPFWQLGNYGESLQDISDYVLPDGIWNVSHQPDATVAKYWDQILTGNDQQKADAQKAINRYIVEQAWFVPMVYPEGFYAYNAKLNVKPSSDFSALHPLLRDFQ